MFPWLEKLGLLGTRTIPGWCCCCWLPPANCEGRCSTVLVMDCTGVGCAATAFCCRGFHAGCSWLWTGRVGVLEILCCPGDTLCPAEWGLAALGCLAVAGESVRVSTGRGLALLFIPARTYCALSPDCTLRSWPSGKANLQLQKENWVLYPKPTVSYHSCLGFFSLGVMELRAKP